MTKISTLKEQKASKKEKASKDKAEKAGSFTLEDVATIGEGAEEIKKIKENKASVKSSKKEILTMDDLLAANEGKFRAFKQGETVEGVITEKAKRAMYVSIGGKTDGLILEKEMKASKVLIDKMKIGDKILVVIYSPENDKGQILLILKKSGSNALWKDYEEKLSSGKVVTVVGKEVNKGGLVVEAGGLQGFIPSSQFGVQAGTNLERFIGKSLEAKVIEVDHEKNRLILSEKDVSEAGMAQAQIAALGDVSVGDVMEGEITGVMPFGFFVKAKAGDGQMFEGLVHISEISWVKVEKPEDFHKVGDKIKVQVISVDRKNGKLGFSLKRLDRDPWTKIEEKYPVDAAVKGEVIRSAPFGVFVRLEPGVEALIHISKLTGDNQFKEGDKVDCFVESVDKDKRKMSLGIMLKEKPIAYK